MTDAGPGPPLGPSRGASLQPAYTAPMLLPTASCSMTFNVLILAISVGICSTGPKRELGLSKIVTGLTGGNVHTQVPWILAVGSRELDS